MALNAAQSVKREIIRTLKTTGAREAKQRRNPVLLEIRAEIEAALHSRRLPHFGLAKPRL